MKQKIISLVALIVSSCAFIASLALLIYGKVKALPNTGAFVFQLIAIALILLLCIGNFIFTCHSLKENEEQLTNDEENEE